MRPPILNPLFAALSALPGVGPKLEKLFARLLSRESEPPRVIDLLFHLPTGFVDRRRVRYFRRPGGVLGPWARSGCAGLTPRVPRRYTLALNGLQGRLETPAWNARLAQRKSTSLTWKGSEVRSLYRAPAFAREAREGCRAEADLAKAGASARELRLGKPAFARPYFTPASSRHFLVKLV